MKICIVSGSRAEFFILKNLIKKINDTKFFKSNFIITGSHMTKDFGNTFNQIVNSKIKIGRKLNLNINNDNEDDISQYFSLGVKLFSNTLNKIKPDLLMILGDRYEIYSQQSQFVLIESLSHIYMVVKKPREQLTKL